jgi:transcription elongation factor S-II
MRSLYLNLKDKGNPSLRESVVSGDLPATRFCQMSSQEMASEERKQADNKIKQANFHSSLGSEEMAAETDAFQCSRCKQVRFAFSSDVLGFLPNQYVLA